MFYHIQNVTISSFLFRSKEQLFIILYFVDELVNIKVIFHFKQIMYM